MKTFKELIEGRSAPAKERRAEFEKMASKHIANMQAVVGSDNKVKATYTHGPKKSHVHIEVEKEVQPHHAKKLEHHYSKLQSDIAGFNLKHVGAKLHDKEFGNN